MQHYLAHAALYGIGTGIFLFLLIALGFDTFIWFLLLSLMLTAAFLATEIIPRENSASSEAKAKRQDKVTVFTPLALTGVMAGAALYFYGADWSGYNSISNGTYLVTCGCPLGSIYLAALLRALVMITRPRREIVESKTENVPSKNAPIFLSSPEKEASGQKTTDIKLDNSQIPAPSSGKTEGSYGLRLLMMFGVVFLGCIALFFISVAINAITPDPSGILTALILLVLGGLPAFGVFKLIQMLRR